MTSIVDSAIGHMTVLTAPTQKQGQPEQSCDRQNSHVTIIGSI